MQALHRYVSGPHSRDYYLLLDEEADHLFAMRLAARIREARGVGNGNADVATANLPEIWMDDSEKVVWYVFAASPGSESDG